MFDRIYELDIDFDSYSSEKQSNVAFMLGETNTSEIIATLKRKTDSINLTGVDVSINIKEKNYEIEKVSCEILDATKGKIKIKIPNKFVDETGNNSFNVYLQKGDKTLKSPTLQYRVVETLQDGIPGIDSDLSYLQTMIVNMQRLEENIIDNVTRKVNDRVNITFNTLTSQQQQDSEVVSARISQDGVVHTSLSERLNAIENKPYVMWEIVEG